MGLSYEFYKNIRLHDIKVRNSFSLLHSIYNTIPKTKGCLENLTEKECCKAWCCRIQNPQLLYSEFLLIWDYVSRNFNDDDICELFRRSMFNAISTSPSKGCVFFDKNTYKCTIHKVRPFNCRIYGITPKSDFDKRYERLKKKYEFDSKADFRHQCELVKTENGQEVTSKDIDTWWNRLKNVERSLGISNKDIHDEDGGSYRSFHDHILLYNMPDNIIMGISGIRMYDNFLDQSYAINEIVMSIKNHFEKVKKND
jgi:Fe-S-cluster containining protein